MEFSTRNHCVFKLLGVPGPKPWPLVGNFPSLIKCGMTRDDYLVKKYGRIFGYFEGMIPVLFIADVDYIKQITIKDFDKFRNRRILLGQEELNKAVSLLEDEEWKIIRNVITPTFTSGKLKK
uniref:Cytochrome P450 n=1 Tax=Romanomermis culicivorax TaxID=13658 RepID=A0A915K8G6_ROMCU